MSGTAELQGVEHRAVALAALQEQLPLGAKLAQIHDLLLADAPEIERIAVALYDEPSRLLKTFVHSSGGAQPLSHYESPMAEAPGLEEMMQTGRARVVQDLAVFAAGDHEHTVRVSAGGYRSSYTFPMRYAGRCNGFIFFNASVPQCFTEATLARLDVFAHLIAGIVLNEINAVRTLLGALRSANEMVHYRDPETGLHLERMSRYARIIARQLARAGVYPFDDEFIENVFLFAPLHDVGKIGVPDEVLLKPARLNEREFEIMRMHTTKGRHIIDAIVDNFGLQGYENIDILRNIAEFHHETMDGSGYPLGIAGREIPIEARIIAVADIFDALTSERPYKKAWTNEQAFAFLRSAAGEKLDCDCVDALEHCLASVREVQREFSEAEPASA